MALPPLEAWVDRLRQLQPVNTQQLGAKNLADFYGDMADQVEGVGGSPGIFTFNRSLFVATLAPQFIPDPSAPSWANRIADAWQVAVASSVISPGTVINPAWTASVVDIQTAPIGSATIITLSAAKSVLKAELIKSAGQFSNDTESGLVAFAKAFREATKAFTFLTIGLAIPGTPLPIPTPAQ